MRQNRVLHDLGLAVICNIVVHLVINAVVFYYNITKYSKTINFKVMTVMFECTCNSALE